MWGQGGVVLDKRGLVAVELACSLSRDQLKEEQGKGTGKLGLEGIELWRSGRCQTSQLVKSSAHMELSKAC